MQSCKVITLRIPPEEARRAEIIARAEEISVNEVFRRALLHYFELKRADTDFVGRVQAMLAQDAELIGKL
jgi:predicted transcriptional regulator